MTTKIEWVKNTDGTQGYTINPVKGLCPMACSYCYARAMYKRFGWNPEIRFEWSVANDIAKMKAGSRIFWGSTFELFGDWVNPDWMKLIFGFIRNYAQDKTHILLTKQPQNLARWSPFPENCWIGVSATNQEQYATGMWELRKIQATVKFFSFEPLLSEIKIIPEYKIDWIIIGQQTPVQPKTTPKIEWIREIVEAADSAGVPVFLKDNLKPLIFKDPLFAEGFVNWAGELRQEFPKG